MNDAVREDIRKLPQLIIGFVLLSLGIVLTLRANIGVSSWMVFHDGLSVTTKISIGWVTIWFGLIILSLSIIFLKTKMGIGTILNIAVVGPMINFFLYVSEDVTNKPLVQGLMFTGGLLILTFGRSMYISAKLGPGPRDGLFVGLSRTTQIDVKYIKPAIEFTVLIIGYLLGGQFGVGTVIAMILSGYLVQFFFTLFGFNPKIVNQRNFDEYFI